MLKRLSFVALVLLFLPLSAAAVPYESPVKPPKYFDQPQNPDPDDHIAFEELQNLQANIGTVSCGGWINDSLEWWGDVITSSQQFPGRNAVPFVDITTGMAMRGNFEYPDETYGFMSACDARDPQYNPNRLCLIGEGTATPEQCRQLYEYWMMKASEPADQHCDDGTAIPRCYDFTMECRGSQCRTPVPPSLSVVCNPVPPGGVTVNFVQSSFYRHYVTEDLEKGAPVWSEGNKQVVKGDCYEQYYEQDALVETTGWWQHHCELTETDESDDDKKSPEWKAEGFPQKESYMGVPSTPDFQPGDRGITSPWFPDTWTNMTFLDIEGARKKAEDAGEEFLEPDFDSLLSYRPPAREVVTATGSGLFRTDGFDDTTDVNSGRGDREFTRWWQEQQMRLMKIIQMPSIRLILPARFATGLDRDDPLFAVGARPNEPEGTVELELRAGSDELGAILDSLHRSWTLPVHEVRIPVLVPAASVAELDNVIAQWRQWGIRTNSEDAAQKYIDRLETYKTQIERVRLLREVIAKQLTSVLESQKEIRGFFADWYFANVERLMPWLEQTWQKHHTQSKWMESSNLLLTLHDYYELTWCSNARYTAPIYSLLDDWLPGRPELRGLWEDDYMLPDWPVYPDISADFSDLTISPSAVELPVLDVTQIKLKLPKPPDGVPGLDVLPDNLPMIPEDQLAPVATIFDDYLQPEVHLPEMILIDLPPPPGEFDRVFEVMDNIYWMLYSAVTSYGNFTQSIEPQRDGETQIAKEYRRIVHTEFDLRERVGRLFARRAPLWQEDYQGRINRKGKGTPTCDDDIICMTLPPEKITSFRWHLQANVADWQDFQSIADELKEYTLPKDSPDDDTDGNPYSDASIKMLERIFSPVTPLKVDLAPKE